MTGMTGKQQEAYYLLLLWGTMLSFFLQSSLLLLYKIIRKWADLALMQPPVY